MERHSVDLMLKKSVYHSFPGVNSVSTSIEAKNNNSRAALTFQSSERRTTKSTDSPATPVISPPAEYTVESLGIRALKTRISWRRSPPSWGCLESLATGIGSKYLSNDSYVCGRDESCDICINHRLLSKSHCRVYRSFKNLDETKFYIENLSRNSTFVNDIRLGKNQTMEILPFDIIRLTEKRSPKNPFFRFRCPTEEIRFSDNYFLGPLVGSGYFGDIFRATRKHSGRCYAVKVIEVKDPFLRPAAMEQLKTEANILLTLEKHPNIVDIFQVFEEGSRIYIVLEFIEHGDLYQFISEQILTEDQVRFILRQLFEAIKFLHSQGVVHRDIKPENVLIASKEKLHMKLTDFGLAKVQMYNELFTTQCGTPVYVAPEVLITAEPREYGKQCDLWSLGVVLYVCLFNTAPFKEENSMPMIPKQQCDIVKSLSRAPRWKDASEEVKDLIQQLITINPAERVTIDEAMAHPWMQLKTDVMESMMDAIPISFED